MTKLIIDLNQVGHIASAANAFVAGFCADLCFRSVCTDCGKQVHPTLAMAQDQSSGLNYKFIQDYKQGDLRRLAKRVTNGDCCIDCMMKEMDKRGIFDDT